MTYKEISTEFARVSSLVTKKHSIYNKAKEKSKSFKGLKTFLNEKQLKHLHDNILELKQVNINNYE